MDILQNEFERIDDLQYKGLRIIQDRRKFCFGTDAVLLSQFADIRRGDRVVDLGTGTGIIPILLAGRVEDARITGLEIQPDSVALAQRSVALNNLGVRVRIVHGDIRNSGEILGKNKYSLVISNPPYRKVGSGLINPSDSKALARHEILCTLEDVLASAAVLLESGGRFAMIHQTDRLVDIIYGMRRLKLEPKRIRLVHPKAGKPPNLVLIEGMLHGRPYLKWLPPLFVYGENGDYTEEMKRIYHIEADGFKTGENAAITDCICPITDKGE